LVGSNNPYPINGSLTRPRIFQFLVQSIDSVRLFQIRSDCGQSIGEDGVIFFERVTNDDPVKEAEAAGKQERGAEREE
jgi:hypothetical protein